jgi:hypothetical protein
VTILSLLNENFTKICPSVDTYDAIERGCLSPTFIMPPKPENCNHMSNIAFCSSYFPGCILVFQIRFLVLTLHTSKLVKLVQDMVKMQKLRFPKEICGAAKLPGVVEDAYHPKVLDIKHFPLCLY